ncbi:hypothetical protein BH23ACT8_BH23ACT8_11080 [soil metagenome]|jgi:hypothetical protein
MANIAAVARLVTPSLGVDVGDVVFGGAGRE